MSIEISEIGLFILLLVSEIYFWLGRTGWEDVELLDLTCTVPGAQCSHGFLFSPWFGSQPANRYFLRSYHVPMVCQVLRNDRGVCSSVLKALDHTV